LLERNGLVIDYISYNDQGSWPVEAFHNSKIMVLKSTSADNHFGENWYADAIDNVFNSIDSLISDEFIVYPNPSYNKVNIIVQSGNSHDILIYSVQGMLLDRYSMNGLNVTEIDLSIYNQGVIILKIGNQIRKVIVLK
jgi:hypothetical protein